MRGAVKNLLSTVVKVTASGSAVTIRNPLGVASIDVHREHLVALHAITLRLKDELLPIGRKISLGVFSGKSKLLDVSEKSLLTGNDQSVLCLND
jgi:hypothetical protein